MIELVNITYSYGSKPVLENFDLRIPAEQLTCLLGSSGCGKTTVLRLIAGLEIPQRGVVALFGQTASANGEIIFPPKDRNAGFVFQDLALWPHFTVYENISFGLKERKIPGFHAKVNDALDFFELKKHANKFPHQLSGGQKQLVAIARALVLEPKILLMDEPLANLDVKLKRKLLGKISDLKKDFNLTIVYVTHDHREAFAIADTIAVMNNGSIVEIGSPEEIKNSGNKFVKYFLEY